MPDRTIVTDRTGRTFTRVRSAILAAALAVAASLSWGVAQSFDPLPGSELLLTDADGRRFVGFGTVDARGVHVELQGAAQELRVVLIAPDGSSTTFRAIWSEGRLRVARVPGDQDGDQDGDQEGDEDGAAPDAPDTPATSDEASFGVDLADALATDGRALWIAADGNEERLVPPTHDAERVGDEEGAAAEVEDPEAEGPGAEEPEEPDDALPGDPPADDPSPPLPDVDPPDAGPILGDPDDGREDGDAGDDPDDGADEEDDADDADDGDDGDEPSGPLPDVPDLP